MCLSRRIRSFVALAILVPVLETVALDGSNDVVLAVPTETATGWKTFEVISGGDTLGSLAKEGFSWTNGNFQDWDGLGAYCSDPDTLRVFVNHENRENSTFSRVDLDLSALKAWVVAGIANNSNSNQVLPADPVVRAVSRGWLSVDQAGTDPINNPCSGNVWLRDTFSEGCGFADDLYLLGEEVFSLQNGYVWVMDLENRKLYEVTAVGAGSWENATPVDTRRDDTLALLLSEDAGSSSTGTAPLALYVGEKVATGDFLERNGLASGAVYYWHADSGATNGTLSGIFSSGGGTSVSGYWSTTEAGAVLFSKLEDVHVNVDKDSSQFGLEVALASQGEGVFLIDCSQLIFDTGDLREGSNATVIELLYEAGTQSASNDFSGMDNLAWSANGMIYVNEDDGEGDVWKVDATTGEAFQILDANFVAETSGIIDVSFELGYRAGSVFLSSGHDNTLTNNQIAMLVSPEAALLTSGYLDWVAGFTSLSTDAVRLKAADPDFDGLSNELEYAFGLNPESRDARPELSFVHEVNAVRASFQPVRSLDEVDYYIDYTVDLALGFDQTMIVRASDLDDQGQAVFYLPAAPTVFARLRAVVP